MQRARGDIVATMALFAAFLLPIAIIAGPTSAQDDGPSGNHALVLASISMDHTPSGLTIAARAHALTGGDYEADMRIEKDGPSGTMSTRQGNALTLAAGDTADIARVGLSLAPGDSLSIRVDIYHDGELIAETTAETAH